MAHPSQLPQQQPDLSIPTFFAKLPDADRPKLRTWHASSCGSAIVIYGFEEVYVDDADVDSPWDKADNLAHAIAALKRIAEAVATAATMVTDTDPTTLTGTEETPLQSLVPLMLQPSFNPEMSTRTFTSPTR
jgi:hypothetical protein